MNVLDIEDRLISKLVGCSLLLLCKTQNTTMKSSKNRVKYMIKISINFYSKFLIK